MTAFVKPAAARAHRQLPHLCDRLFMTDGGLETTLVFHDGVDLPCFAAFVLLQTADGSARLRRYYERYIASAKTHGTGFVLESPTWRANPDWADRLGLELGELDRLNAQAIDLMHALRSEHDSPATPMVVSGCVGPRGDGYRPEALMAAEQARAYHARQVETFAAAGADIVTAITMTNVAEAIGVVRAAGDAGLPVVISFTVETDGRLPTGDPLPDAISAVDDATAYAPAYYMVNCAHPSHFGPALERGAAWLKRVGGLRANASCKSHAELDEATELDDGDPDAFGREHADLAAALPRLAVLGGCCGTDHRHVSAAARSIARLRAEAAGQGSPLAGVVNSV